MTLARLVLTTYPSPLGLLTIVTGPAGLCRLAFPGEASGLARNSLAGEFPRAVFVEEKEKAGYSCPAVLRQLEEYFAGRRFTFDLPLDLRGTPFQREVWAALSKIPYGTTCSYGDIARAVGRPGAARAVGQAIGRNPVAIIIPCHRVIGKDGRLVGFGGGLEVKEWLLQFEKDHARLQPARTSP
ncbi:MAG: methylated-DNA--[protein]-cysteine S-methyltransferase [Moorella sp. (in: Bacteria)]|nr:methylated-DNA--[protein]-cysteine S-methyltransferase [Moorella sp. (in: firmicutes)]